MPIMIDEYVMKPLYDFLKEKTTSDINRETYLTCCLKDYKNKVTISLVFLREWRYDADYDQIVIPKVGAVFTLPSYWISVDSKLAEEYFRYLIQAFYDEYVSNWVASGNIPGTDSSANVNGTTVGSGQIMPPIPGNQSDNCPICGTYI